jgi:phenylalanyl-tRNA synthetase beta chain
MVEADLYDLKGVLSAVLGGEVDFETQAPEWKLGLCVRVTLEGKVVGIAGQLRPSEARAMDLHGAVFGAEVSLESVLGEIHRDPVYRELPRFPSVTRDMALVAPSGLEHRKIVEVLRAENEPLLKEIALFDVFTDPTGERVALGAKSLGYSLTYRAADRTLTTDEVNAAHGRLKQRVTAELGVQARE